MFRFSEAIPDRWAAAVLGVGLVLGLLVLAEVLLAASGAELPDPYPPRLGPRGVAEGEQALFTYDPVLLWRQLPGVTKRLRSRTGRTHAISTNQLGLRDDPPAAPGGVVPLRVLSLGDSNTWGDGVEGRETYSNVLEALLADVVPASVEVFNAGVPGYSTVQSMALQAELFERFAFQGVILYHLGADLQPAFRPDSTYPVRGPFRGIHDLLIRFRLFRLVRHLRSSGATLADRAVADSQRVPVEEYAENLRQMIRRAREEGAEPVVVIPLPLCTQSGCPSQLHGEDRAEVDRYLARLDAQEPRYREALRGVARDAGCRTVDLPRLVQDDPHRFRYYLDLSHPTVEGHRYIARALAPSLGEVLRKRAVSSGSEGGRRAASGDEGGAIRDSQEINRK